MARTIECARCGGRMEVGFILDLGESNRRRQATWSEGAPVKSFWTGLKNGPKRPVDTYRCTKCGYLESYATEPAK